MTEPAIQRQFLTALEDGDLDRLHEVLALGADVNLPTNDPDGQTPLIRAVVAGQLEIVRALLAAGAQVNLPESQRRHRTPLMFAHPHLEILRELLNAGAEVNARSATHESVSPIDGTRRRRGRETALHFAAGANHAEAVRLLIAAGAELEARGADGLAPLDVALRAGTPTEAAQALVEAGAPITPERLALMHAAAHAPDSDILEFPWASADLAQPQEVSPVSSTPSIAPANESNDGEARCPSCHALLYSRRARLCGSCNAILPAEQVLSDEEAASRDNEREWARRLADGFSNATSSAEAPARSRPTTPASPASVEDLLQRTSFTEEFKRRHRPDFWIYLVAYFCFALTFVFLAEMVPGLPISVVLFPLGFLVFSGFRAWRRASPICPNCRQNIRRCPAAWCHGCGKRLRGKHCPDCSTNPAWNGSIDYCPGCGVELDSGIPRWRANKSVFQCFVFLS